MKQFLLFLIIFLSFFGCSSNKTYSVDLSSINKSDAVLIDVRTAKEFDSGHLDGAMNVALDEIQNNPDDFPVGPEKEIILYCGSGRRAGIAMEVLKSRGFKHVINAGGYEELKKRQFSPSI